MQVRNCWHYSLCNDLFEFVWNLKVMSSHELVQSLSLINMFKKDVYLHKNYYTCLLSSKQLPIPIILGWFNPESISISLMTRFKRTGYTNLYFS